jgi:mRNA interferase MazF
MPIQRGEIYFVDLDPVQGREQGGRRPVLVISANAVNRLPLVVTVVVGTNGNNVARDYPINVRLSTVESGLQMETVFLCFQVRSLDPRRFSGSAVSTVSSAALAKVENTVRRCLAL